MLPRCHSRRFSVVRLARIPGCFHCGCWRRALRPLAAGWEQQAILAAVAQSEHLLHKIAGLSADGALLSRRTVLTVTLGKGLSYYQKCYLCSVVPWYRLVKLTSSSDGCKVSQRLLKCLRATSVSDIPVRRSSTTCTYTNLTLRQLSVSQEFSANLGVERKLMIQQPKPHPIKISHHS